MTGGMSSPTRDAYAGVDRAPRTWRPLAAGASGRRSRCLHRPWHPDVVVEIETGHHGARRGTRSGGRRGSSGRGDTGLRERERLSPSARQRTLQGSRRPFPVPGQKRPGTAMQPHGSFTRTGASAPGVVPRQAELAEVVSAPGGQQRLQVEVIARLCSCRRRRRSPSCPRAASPSWARCSRRSSLQSPNSPSALPAPSMYTLPVEGTPGHARGRGWRCPLLRRCRRRSDRGHFALSFTFKARRCSSWCHCRARPPRCSPRAYTRRLEVPAPDRSSRRRRSRSP